MYFSLSFLQVLTVLIKLGGSVNAVSPTKNIYTNEEASTQESAILIADEGSALVKPEFSSIEASKAHRDKIIEYTKPLNSRFKRSPLFTRR